MMEFGVHYLRKEDDCLFVSGRCYKGPIVVGNKFNRVTKPGSIFVGDDNSLIQEERHVSLLVKSIKAYGHILRELDEGVTAELELSGDGIESVGEGSILRSSD